MREFLMFTCGVVLCAIIGTVAFCGGWCNGATAMYEHSLQSGKKYRVTVVEDTDGTEDTSPGRAKPGPVVRATEVTRKAGTEKVGTTVKNPG